MTKIDEIGQAVEKGKKKIIAILVQEALDEGCDAMDILNTGMIGAMDNVGEKFKNGDIYVPEMLIAAKTMKKGVDVLKPYLSADATGSMGKYILATVEGDLHDIGKNLVGMMIESAGFEVIDLGVDVKNEVIIEAIRQNPDVKIVGLSALLTTTMPALGDAVAAIKGSDVEKSFKIMVGGAPVTQAFADEIGADAFAEDAGSAAKVAKEIA